MPGRLPGTKQSLAYVLRGARHIVAAGSYPAREAERAAGRSLPITVVPPGVDTDRFRPLSDDERVAARTRFGLPADAELIVSISRLVPRKGFDTAIRAAATLRRSRPESGAGDLGRRSRRATTATLADDLSAPVRFLGRVGNEDLPRLYGCADVYTMLCRNRWAGLEQEGFGIVFLEAAACEVPQVAGDSGGAEDAVRRRCHRGDGPPRRRRPRGCRCIRAVARRSRVAAHDGSRRPPPSGRGVLLRRVVEAAGCLFDALP